MLFYQPLFQHTRISFSWPKKKIGMKTLKRFTQTPLEIWPPSLMFRSGKSHSISPCASTPPRVVETERRYCTFLIQGLNQYTCHKQGQVISFRRERSLLCRDTHNKHSLSAHRHENGSSIRGHQCLDCEMWPATAAWRSQTWIWIAWPFTLRAGNMFHIRGSRLCMVGEINACNFLPAATFK